MATTIKLAKSQLAIIAAALDMYIVNTPARAHIGPHGEDEALCLRDMVRDTLDAPTDGVEHWYCDTYPAGS